MKLSKAQQKLLKQLNNGHLLKVSRVDEKGLHFNLFDKDGQSVKNPKPRTVLNLVEMDLIKKAWLFNRFKITKKGLKYVSEETGSI